MKHHRKEVGTAVRSNASYGDIGHGESGIDRDGALGAGDPNQPGRGQMPASKAQEAASAERMFGDRPRKGGELKRG